MKQEFQQKSNTKTNTNSVINKNKSSKDSNTKDAFENNFPQQQQQLNQQDWQNFLDTYMINKIICQPVQERLFLINHIVQDQTFQDELYESLWKVDNSTQIKKLKLKNTSKSQNKVQPFIGYSSLFSNASSNNNNQLDSLIKNKNKSNIKTLQNSNEDKYSSLSQYLAQSPNKKNNQMLKTLDQTQEICSQIDPQIGSTKKASGKVNYYDYFGNSKHMKHNIGCCYINFK